MIDWKTIWYNKGISDIDDLRTLDGFENTTIDEKSVADKICQFMNLKVEDRVLEIGCGAGMIAQFLKCIYTGVDYSASLLEKHKALLNNNVFYAEADHLPFENRTFDKVFAFSVFQYFPDKQYALRVISEMKRVAQHCVFIGDIPRQSHTPEHILYSIDEFSGWHVLKGFYNPERFNALLWTKPE